MSYHQDPDWRTRPAPVVDRNKLQRLRRRARKHGLSLWVERDGYHRAMGIYYLSPQDGGQTIFGPAPLDAIEANLDSIIEVAEARRARLKRPALRLGNRVRTPDQSCPWRTPTA
jgi:hypothetical protein